MGNPVHEPTIAKTQGISYANAQANGPVKQEKGKLIGGGGIQSIPPPSTSSVDNSVLAGLIRMIHKHGPKAGHAIVDSGLKASNSPIYDKAGVHSFRDFTDLAIDKGLVTLGHGRSRKGKKVDTVFLGPDWRSHYPITDALPSVTCGGADSRSYMARRRGFFRALGLAACIWLFPNSC